MLAQPLGLVSTAEDTIGYTHHLVNTRLVQNLMILHYIGYGNVTLLLWGKAKKFTTSDHGGKTHRD